MKIKYLLLSAAATFAVSALTGCHGNLSALPDDPIVFKTSELEATEEQTGYKTIEHDGRVYIMYGGIRAKGPLRDMTYACGDCLGYVEGDESDRIYALDGGSQDEWLIEYCIDGFMEQHVVLREISQKGSGNVPSSVRAFDYDYWK